MAIGYNTQPYPGQSNLNAAVAGQNPLMTSNQGIGSNPSYSSQTAMGILNPDGTYGGNANAPVGNQAIGQPGFNQVNSPGYGPQQNIGSGNPVFDAMGTGVNSTAQEMFPDRYPQNPTVTNNTTNPNINYKGMTPTMVSRNNPYGSPLAEESGVKGQAYFDDLYANRASINQNPNDPRVQELREMARGAVSGDGPWTPPSGWFTANPNSQGNAPQQQGGVSGMDVLKNEYQSGPGPMSQDPTTPPGYGQLQHPGGVYDDETGWNEGYSGMDVLENQYRPLQQALGSQQRPNVRNNWDGIRQRGGGDQRQGYGGWNERERYGRMR